MESITSELLDLWGSFFSEHWKFNVGCKKAKKMQQKIDGFIDNLIWIGNVKFSLLLREYS